MTGQPNREVLWQTSDHARSFIIPEHCPLKSGSFPICSFDGREALADKSWLWRFEVSEQEASDWVKRELGDALDMLSDEIDSGLSKMRGALTKARLAPTKSGSKVKPDALPALIEFVARLPRAVVESLSSDEDQVASARRDLLKIQQRLRAAGIDVGDKLEQFPERLAGLRNEAAARTKHEN